MSLFLNWLFTAIATIISIYILPGIKTKKVSIILLAGVIFGAIDLLVQPFLALLRLPSNVYTLGIFTFAVNTLLALLLSRIMAGFEVKNILWAFLFGLLIYIIALVLSILFLIIYATV